MKQAKRTTLKRKADIIFSKKIRSKGYCELRGLDHIACSENLQTMHIVGRSNYNLRWDQINALCGCGGHHRFYTSNPYDFYQLLDKHFPERMKYINEHKNELWDKDYDRLLKELKDWQP